MSVSPKLKRGDIVEYVPHSAGAQTEAAGMIGIILRMCPSSDEDHAEVSWITRTCPPWAGSNPETVAIENVRVLGWCDLEDDDASFA